MTDRTNNPNDTYVDAARWMAGVFRDDLLQAATERHEPPVIDPETGKDLAALITSDQLPDRARALELARAAMNGTASPSIGTLGVLFSVFSDDPDIRGQALQAMKEWRQSRE